ncbi:MAG: xanthine dehydrogenase family protein molybdopterin-binding subunit [Chloroflexi bacterium]|nr:xanthine dehydrogenase family protein molybdopterin-binding subunit [Chloroflexota bacterium]
MTIAQDPTSRYAVIGTRPIRHDGYDKVTGRAEYGADVSMPGMVWGDILRSPHAHARILKVDLSKAAAMPGVLAVVSGLDLPRNGRREIDVRGGVTHLPDVSANILATHKAMYRGHAVAAVAAVDRETARVALALIEVEYEPLPAVLSIDDAIAADAPILLDDLIGDHLGEDVWGTNIARHFRLEFGDPDAAFATSSLVVEREVEVGMAHQGYIEPHVATALWGEDGRITIWSSTQGMFGVRDHTAAFLGIDESRVRVMPVEIGGGFGGKGAVYLPPIAALLSRDAGRPVRIVMDMRNVLEATGPTGAAKVRVKVGVTDDGLINAAQADLKYEAGAYPGSWVGVGARSVFSCYNVANTRIDGYDIVVNKPRAAAYRAPCVPQAVFATESAVDEICEAKGWDKIEFRLANASREGTRRSDGPRFPRIGHEEVLRATRDSDHWRTPLERIGPDGRLRGRGIASAYCGNAGGKSSVVLSLNTDGTVALLEGSADLSGSRAIVAMQVAEALGLGVEDVRPVIPDTGSIGYTATTGGSRVANATGLAAYQAAESLIAKLKERAAIGWGIAPEEVAFKGGQFSSRTDPELSVGLKGLAARLDGTGGPVMASGSVDLPDGGGGVFGTHIADVEIDPETGKTDVVRYTVIQDAGTAIQPQAVEGQMQGGAAQGIGWALNEEYVLNEDGAMANASFLDYRMPTATDLPFIETVIVEVPNPAHPFGVRGVGEIPIGPPLAAIGNAIHDALGIRLTTTPMKPGRILEALAQRTVE